VEHAAAGVLHTFDFMANISTAALLSDGDTRSRVLKLALPAVGEQFLNTLVGLADIYLVGNLSQQATRVLGYSSDAALNSVGLGNQMGWLIMVLFVSTGVGSTALIARAVGADNEADKRRFLRHSLLIALGVGVLGMLAAVLLGGPFLWLLGASSPGIDTNVLPLGDAYLNALGAGMIPSAFLFVGMACMRGAGDTRTPLLVMLGVNAANILVTWLLVNGELGFPTMGVVGAGFATALARTGGGLVVLWLLWRGRSGLKFDMGLNFDPQIIRRLLRIGMPTAGEMFIFHGALLIFTRFITSLGTVPYAAHITTINIESLSFLPGLGYAAAAGALVGQALGARTPDQGERYVYEALGQGMLMMSSIGLLMIFLPDVLFSFFVNDPAVVAAGTEPLRAAGLVQPALAVNFILNGALRGAGDTKWPLYTRIISTWGMRLPLTWLLVLVLDAGLNGVWMAMCADFTLQSMLALWRFRSGFWRQIEV
jgi:putative MATE family efflux protein